MTLGEWVGLAGGVSILISATYGLVWKLMIAPLKAENVAHEKRIQKLEDNLNELKKEFDRKWEENSKEDQKVKDRVLNMEVKHDQSMEKIDNLRDDIRLNFGKLFQFMEERQKTEANLAQKIAVLEQKLI